jgi:hypothetical protein
MNELELHCIAEEPNLRILSWHGKALYASRRYTLLQAFPEESPLIWRVVGRFHPVWWRSLSASLPLTYRLCRDGFHNLVVLSSGHLIASVAGAIVTLSPGNEEFVISHRIQRGTRPLNLAVTDDDKIFWGEYFDNRDRDEVYIYGSENFGKTWEIVYTFPKQQIRHIHNVVYDRWNDCLWILTGDYGTECQIVRASCDWKTVEIVFSGEQQTRAVAAIPTQEAVYFATDTPLENNYIYRLDRAGKLEQLAAIDSSSLYGCQVGRAFFFSTMVEPSRNNRIRYSRLYGSTNGLSWKALLEWRKDLWSMTLFQYGNTILPGGNNTTNLLALTSIAVEKNDLKTTIWRIATS